MTLDIIQNVGAVCGVIVTVIGLVVMIIKPVRDKFAEFVTKTNNTKETNEKIDKLIEIGEKRSIQITEIQNELHNQSDELRNQSDALMGTMRNTILYIFFQYKDSPTIPAMQYQSAEDLYAAYHKLGGNGTATHVMEELRKKTIE